MSENPSNPTPAPVQTPENDAPGIRVAIYDSGHEFLQIQDPTGKWCNVPRVRVPYDSTDNDENLPPLEQRVGFVKAQQILASKK